MSLQNITLTANYFAVTHPAGVTDIHNYVFRQMIKKNKVNTFLSTKVIFFTNGTHICLRTTATDEHIPMSTETFNLSLGQKITGKVMIPLNRECGFSSQEIEEYKEIHGEAPKGNKGKKRKNLTVEEATQFTLTALEKKGLSQVSFTKSEPGPELQILKFKVDTVDLEFTAVVEDLIEFEQGWLHGVGRDKTFGFGMIRLFGSNYSCPDNIHYK